MVSKYLVSVETVKIKDFIFSTNKLKIIRGASFLLDYINQKLLPEIIRNHKIIDKDIVYINAGNAKFFVENEGKANEIVAEIKRVYREYAPGSKMVISVIEQKKDEKVWDVFDRAAKATAKEKSNGFEILNIDIPFIKKCSLCDTNPGEFKNKDIKKHIFPIDSIENHIDKINNLIGENEVICRECLNKLAFSTLIKDSEQNFKHFYLEFKEKFQDFEAANEIGDYSSNKNFIGFMYADGDSLGDFLKNVKNRYKDEKEYLAFYKEFSAKLDRVTKESLIEVIEEMRDRFPENAGKRNYGEFLIVGGDDLCAVFPPNLIMEISIKYQEIFQDKMEEFWKNHFEDNSEISNITTSCGVVIAKHKTPMYYLFDKSLNLQKKAKKKRYKEFFGKESEYKKGFIDFQVIGSEGNVDIEEFRKTVKNCIRRPYIVDKSENGKNNIGYLIDLIKELKMSDFPKTKIRKFYESGVKYFNSNSKMINFLIGNDILDKVLKMQKRHQDLVEKLFYEDESFESTTVDLSNIFDILELYSFIEKSKEEVKDEV